MILPTLNLRSPRFRRDPHDFYTAARAQCGLAKAEGLDAYLAVRHETCAALLKDPRIGLDEFAGASPAHPLHAYFQMRKGLMLFANAPRHTALRQPAQSAFSPRLIKRYENRIRALASESVTLLQERLIAGEQVDFVREVSLPFVSQVICHVVGMPEQDHALLAQLTQDVADGLDPFGAEHDLQRAGEGYLSFVTYMQDQLAHQRWRQQAEEFTDTFLGDIARCPHMLGDFRTKADLISTTVMLLAAGHLTTNHSLSLGLNSILQHTPQLLADQSRPITPNLVEELFRFHTPAQITRRTVRENITIEGQTLYEGQALWLALVSANRDERVFDHPQELDFQRKKNPHLAFGAGSHFCLGTHLARLQLRVFLEELQGRIPSLRVADLTPDHNLVFRGLRKLMLTM